MIIALGSITLNLGFSFLYFLTFYGAALIWSCTFWYNSYIVLTLFASKHFIQSENCFLCFYGEFFFKSSKYSWTWSPKILLLKAFESNVGFHPYNCVYPGNILFECGIFTPASQHPFIAAKILLPFFALTNPISKAALKALLVGFAT